MVKMHAEYFLFWSTCAIEEERSEMAFGGKMKRLDVARGKLFVRLSRRSEWTVEKKMQE